MKLVEPCANYSRTRCAYGPRTSACPKFLSAATFPGPRPRHPLPRDITKEKLDILATATPSISTQIRKHGLRPDCRLAVLLPVKTVGGWATAALRIRRGLRAVTSTDGMTADFLPPFDMKFLGETATRIING